MNHKQRLLVDILDDIGGAPRSLISQISQLDTKNFGITVSASMPENNINTLINFNSNIIQAPRFPSISLVAILRARTKWVKLLTEQSPDIIVSNRASQFRYLSGIASQLRIPLLVVVPGGNPTKIQLLSARDHITICYSNENMVRLLQAGVPKQNIFLCTNRIEVEREVPRLPRRAEGTLKIGVIGNLKNATLQGLKNFMDFLLTSDGRGWQRIEVHSFGRNLLSTSECDLLTFLKSPHIEMPNNMKFISHGWIEDIEKEAFKMDLIVGKGRSVILGAMLGIPSYVLLDRPGVIRITQSSFGELKEKNFTGRESYAGFEDLAKLLKDNRYYAEIGSDSMNVALAVRDEYEASGSKLVFEKAIQLAINSKPWNHGFRAVLLSSVLYIYSTVILDYVLRKMRRAYKFIERGKS